MSIQPDLRGWQKAIWMLLIGGLIVVELRSISHDRTDIDAKANEARQLQDQAFALVLQKEDTVFYETLRGFKNEENRMTGGNSTPEFFVQIANGNKSDTAYVTFTLTVKGDNPLRTLNVSFGQSLCSYRHENWFQ